MTLRIYNTLTRRKEAFSPLQPGQVTIYSCGPTVYRYVHVGNLRTFMFADLLGRVFRYLGYQVRKVMNITDVGHLTDDQFDRGEDKMLVQARLEDRSPEEIAAFYTDAFHHDLALVNVIPADAYPRASDHIPRMIEMIEALIARGHAYAVEGAVFYDVASFPAYGRLSRNQTDRLVFGMRGEPHPGKRNPGDFALWKPAGERRSQSWDSPWGRGFPGWHIECSAMSTELLGERFDLHTGGIDNIFPHHEAEIAQSEGVYGHQVVSYWMHADHLMLSGTRMAKSAGNFFRITELVEQGIDPLAFRYLILQAKYRTKLNFNPEALSGADRTLRHLRQKVAEWRSGPTGGGETYAERFRARLEDDLDLPGVMALISELVHSTVPTGTCASFLLDFDRVLGLDLGREAAEVEAPPEVAALLERRSAARAARDWREADRLRAEIAGFGFTVSDQPQGQQLRRT